MTTTEELSELAAQYLQAQRRRRKIQRQLNRLHRLNRSPEGTEYKHWLEVHSLRLIEVDTRIFELESHPDFGKFRARALGTKIAPYVGSAILIAAALGVLYGVYSIARAVGWF